MPADALDAAAFRSLYRHVEQASLWGTSDRRGALNNITPAHVLAAVGEVRKGRTVSLARPIEDVPSADNPEHCGHEMTGGADDHAAGAGLHFAMDRFVMNVHGNADSH